MHRTFFLLLFGAITAFAQFQHVKLGVKGGGYFTDFHADRYGNVDSSGRYAVGPSVEVFLRKDISIEANALFRPNFSRSRFTFADTNGEYREDGNSVEVPILFKKYFGNGPVRPYAGIGPNIRRLFDRDTSLVCRGCTDGLLTSSGGEANGSTTLGGTIAAGVELPRFGPRWTMEFRYTLYQSKYTGAPGGKENQNQAGVFLGITF